MPELLAKPEPSFHIDTHTRDDMRRRTKRTVCGRGGAVSAVAAPSETRARTYVLFLCTRAVVYACTRAHATFSNHQPVSVTNSRTISCRFAKPSLWTSLMRFASTLSYLICHTAETCRRCRTHSHTHSPRGERIFVLLLDRHKASSSPPRRVRHVPNGTSAQQQQKCRSLRPNSERARTRT